MSRAYFEEEIKANIDYDIVVENKQNDKRQIDEIVMLMLDTVCSPSATVRINGTDIPTHNPDLKKRLAAYSEKFPTECRLLDDDIELGCMEFDIKKGRLSFRLTEPYSEECRKRASEYAKKNGLKGR